MTLTEITRLLKKCFCPACIRMAMHAACSCGTWPKADIERERESVGGGGGKHTIPYI
jgi:hypothetical protein